MFHSYFSDHHGRAAFPGHHLGFSPRSYPYYTPRPSARSVRPLYSNTSSGRSGWYHDARPWRVNASPCRQNQDTNRIAPFHEHYDSESQTSGSGHYPYINDQQDCDNNYDVTHSQGSTGPRSSSTTDPATDIELYDQSDHECASELLARVENVDPSGKCNAESESGSDLRVKASSHDGHLRYDFEGEDGENHNLSSVRVTSDGSSTSIGSKSPREHQSRSGSISSRRDGDAHLESNVTEASDVESRQHSAAKIIQRAWICHRETLHDRRLRSGLMATRRLNIDLVETMKTYESTDKRYVEDRLTKLLMRCDAILTHGNMDVRKAKKEFTKKVLDILNVVDKELC